MEKVVALRASADFRLLYRWGRKTESPLFRIIVRRNTLSHSRLAFVAAKAINKRATVRNRLRRRAREWVRKHVSAPSEPVDMGIFFKKEAVIAPRKLFYGELEQTIKQALR